MGRGGAVLGSGLGALASHPALPPTSSVTPGKFFNIFSTHSLWAVLSASWASVSASAVWEQVDSVH